MYTWILELIIKQIKRRISRLEWEYEKLMSRPDYDENGKIVWNSFIICQTLVDQLKSRLENMQKRLPKRYLLKQDILKLGLSIHASNFLRGHGLTTVGNLVGKTRWNIYEMEGFGKRTFIYEIIQALGKFGLELKKR
jgi:DNA-directed RNA polymerase alpha subunit